jgi:hypothetical protein
MARGPGGLGPGGPAAASLSQDRRSHGRITITDDHNHPFHWYGPSHWHPGCSETGSRVIEHHHEPATGRPPVSGCHGATGSEPASEARGS